MQRWAGPIALLALLLTGCAMPAQTEEDRTGVSIPSDAIYLNETRELVLSQTRSPAGNQVLKENCLLLPVNFTIVQGRAKIAWTANSETTRELTLLGAETFDHVFADSGPRPSPIEVTFHDVRAEVEGSRYFDFLALLGSDGVMIDQPVVMELQLVVTGEGQPRLIVGKCVVT